MFNPDCGEMLCRCTTDEIARLTAELEHMTSELDDGQVLIAELLADTHSLLQRNSKLRELARLYSDGNQYDAHQLSVKLGLDAAKGDGYHTEGARFRGRSRLAAIDARGDADASYRGEEE